jgi:acyl carrier protein
MLTGGDVLHAYPPADLPFSLVNNYGPTECTVVATSGPVARQGPSDRLPPIGFPIGGTRVYVLDEAGQAVPEGDRGELYIGGAGLARGYRHRPDLTAERFVAHPTGSGERLFRTGDLVRTLPDGQLAFLERTDDQVKVRGFRIELNEVAAALNEHPAVAQSAVIAQEVAPGERRLVGYVVPGADGGLTLSGVREFLGARLPAFMVPAAFVVVGQLPLTPNGKVDRAALPPPDGANTLGDHALVGPRTDAERAVASILAPLLGLEQLDVEANFFALGGHSLLGTQLISRVQETFGVELALRSVFKAPTVAGIAAEVERLLDAKLAALSDEQARSLLTSAPADSERRPG